METSRESYQRSMADGSIANQQRVVLEAVQNFPKRTSKELADIMRIDRVIPARRLSELEALGVVVKSGKRECSIGNRKAYVWELK